MTAAGYHEGEAFTPKVTELKTVEGIVVKLRRKDAATKSEVPVQTIRGIVTRAGQPVTGGRVALRSVGHTTNAPNAFVLRGRTTDGWAFTHATAAVKDGKYELTVPYQKKDWYLAYEVSGRPPTIVGPFEVKLNEAKAVDIACTDPGTVRGRVKTVPPGWEGELWVVAFARTGHRAEARVGAGGTFELTLPPGEYGLKVGHDAFQDKETRVDRPKAPGEKLTKEEADAFSKAWNAPARPWDRAKVVTVEPGRAVTGVELELPDGG